VCYRGWAVNISKVFPVVEEIDDDYDYGECVESSRLQREDEDYRKRQLEWCRMGYTDDGGPA